MLIIFAISLTILCLENKPTRNFSFSPFVAYSNSKIHQLKCPPSQWLPNIKFPIYTAANVSNILENMTESSKMPISSFNTTSKYTTHFKVLSRPYSLCHFFMCPLTALLSKLNSLLFLIKQDIYLLTLLLIVIIYSITIRIKFGTLLIFSNISIKSSFMGIFSIILTNFIYVIIKHFYGFLYIYKLLHSKFYISNMTMAGIASVTPGHFVPLVRFNLSIIYNIKEGHNFSMINPQSDSGLLEKLLNFELPLAMGFSILLFFLFMYINFKIYCINVKKSKTKIYKKSKNKELLVQLILLTIFKCIIIGLVLFAIKQKHAAVHNPRKHVNKQYFLSAEYFGDTYHAMDLYTKSLHEWHAMSKMKFKSYKSFFQILIILSGDISMNPGPTSYPCAKCNRGVGSGILCNTCNLWVHTRCEGLSGSQLNVLSRTGNLNFICCVCREKQHTLHLPSSASLSLTSPPSLSAPSSPLASSLTLDSALTSSPPTTFPSAHFPSASVPSLPLASSSTSETDLSDSAVPEIANSAIPLENDDALPFINESSLPMDSEENFYIRDEHLQNISLDDDSKIFRKKGLHFVHLNCNSLLSKIEEIRQFVLDFKPHVICFSETKIDSSVTSAEVLIDGYSTIRRDRNRHGGGVACYVNNSIHYNERSDFPCDFENIFIDILLPKTTPILFGVVYRPPKTLNFDELLSNSIANSGSFDKQEVYILGDTNYNLLDRKNKLILKKGYRFSNDESNYTTPLYLIKKYVELLRTYGLTQVIEEPTRTTDKTSTLLDHILVNTPSKVVQSGVLSKCISDHDIIYMTRKHQNIKTGKHSAVKIRSMKNYTKELFIQKLNEIQFPDYSIFENVNEAYSDFVTKFMSVIDSICPLRQVRIKTNTKPWFDGNILEAIRVRDKLRKKHKKSGLQVDFEMFKDAQKYAKKLTKLKKCTYIKDQLRENIAKPSKLWKVLKSIGLPSKANNTAKVCLKNKDNALLFEPKETSNVFKEFYENLSQSLVDKLPSAPNKFNLNTTKTFYERLNLSNTFNLREVDQAFVLKMLESTNANKAPGIDKLPGIFIKDGASLLAAPLTQLINLSISFSIFPDPFKIAKLVALYKKGCKTDPKNYRPVSLLPLLSKIFEKVVHLQTEKFLSDNHILYKNQSGFRPLHSTESCLTHLSDQILEASDKGCHTGMILIDLQKAFDTLDHSILLDKLGLLNFSSDTISWFKSYLSNRTFLVNVESTFSEPADLKCGVPQGSILGPLLFLLYINDLPQAVTDCDVRLYADDTCISYTDKKIPEIEVKLNKDFNSLCDWFVDNKLSIHFGEDKTKSILFSPKNQSKRADPIAIKRHDVTLKQFSTVEYLGCLLDETLSGREMALKVLKKVNGKLRFLYRQGKYLNPRLRRMLCNTLIQPHFDFACSAWYPNLTNGLKSKLQIAQNKCIRYCLFLGNREGIRYKHLKEINWLPVKDRVNQFIVASVYKFFNKLAPLYMTDVFVKSERVRTTRSSNESNLYIPLRHHDYGKNCLSYLGATLWNSIPGAIRNVKTCNSFKHKIKDKYFKDIKEDDNSIYNAD